MKTRLSALAALTSVLLATSAFAQTTPPTIVTPPPTVGGGTPSPTPNQPAVNDHTVNQDERQIGHDALRDRQMEGQVTNDQNRLNRLDANGQGNSAQAQKLENQIGHDDSRISSNQTQMNTDAQQAKSFEAAHPNHKWGQVNRDDRAEGRQMTRQREEARQNIRDQKQINYDEAHNIHNGQIARDERQEQRNDHRMGRQEHRIKHERRQAWHDEHHHKTN